MVTRFNLSEWALTHQALILYFIVALFGAGVYSYLRLGQGEDPEFTFKLMVVRTLWPGATAKEVEQQVTERLEKKLQETPWFDFARSYSKPGESLIFVVLKDYTPPKAVPDAWYEVRKKVSDIRYSLPPGVQGPFFNDEFGDTYGIIYAFTSDGYSFAELHDYVEDARRELLRVPDVGKVDILGDQDEKIYIEMSHRKLATLGVNPLEIFAVLQQQNNMVPAGDFETRADRIYIRISGDFKSVESIREIGIQAGGRLFRLGDIAHVYRGYVDPPVLKFRYEGQDALGLAVSMRKGGDIIGLGHALDAQLARIRSNLPVGIDVHQVADQPKVVSRSISEFMRTLGEAIVIVLAVSFLSLGLRTGVVVALSIPLVLATTLLFMKVFGIDLQRISLGALIIALGLLVDDAIIAVEMMAIKMEQGWDRMRAGSFAYTSTAASMLTGTLVTAAGFLPVGLAKSAAGEYTFSIFAVVTTALLVSWVVAVLFTPYLGYKLLPDYSQSPSRRSTLQRLLLAPLGRVFPRLSSARTEPIRDHDVYHRPFYQRFRRLVTWCVSHRWVVISGTLIVFGLSIAGFGQVQQQFFPSANRPELVVDLWLPNGASITATDAQAERFEKVLKADPDVESFVAYIGGGSPRFYLPLDEQLLNANLAEFVVTTKSNQVRDRVAKRLLDVLDNQFTLVRGRVNPLQNGPPVAYPVQFRVSGPDYTVVRALANEVAGIMRANPHMNHVHLDWNELSKIVKLDIDQNKARMIGVTSEGLSNVLYSILSGYSITQFRERDKLIEVLARAEPKERLNLDDIRDINVPTQSGRWVPLSQVATISYALEEGMIWRRNRIPTITVQGDIGGDLQAPVVASQIDRQLEAVRAKLQPGYRLEIGGATEEAARGQASVNAVVPIALLVVFTLLMIHLQSISKTILVVLTAPLGIIGVALFLLVFHVPFGFVAMLGFIALFGMIMRNSVILVDQIDQDVQAGHTLWDAIIESTVRRFRPIMLTAAAAILAMIPLTRSNFWGPMAVAIMGGLLVATVLTLLFLPALYAAWFRVRRPAGATGEGGHTSGQGVERAGSREVTA
ncbi:MAG TPA: efflux RND transporter permease subunit [Burkholderiales bacterium]|nr:efflux RND transporter permease subunit [Burkholderiales bacterium]